MAFMTVVITMLVSSKRAEVADLDHVMVTSNALGVDMFVKETRSGILCRLQ